MSEVLKAMALKRFGTERIEVPVVEPEAAARVFRTGNSSGLNVTPEFNRLRDVLGQIYTALVQVQSSTLELGRMEYPELDEVFKTYRDLRRDMRVRSNVGGAEELYELLAVLAAQPVPFIHIVRELSVNPNSSLEVITRFAAPLKKSREAVANAYRLSNLNTRRILGEFREQKKFYPDWAQIHNAIKYGGGFDHPEMMKGRLDPLLENLFFVPDEDPRRKRLNECQLKVNDFLQRYLIQPLIESMAKEESVIVLENTVIRSRHKGRLSELDDFVYMNHSDRLQERYLNLCELIVSEAAELEIGLEYMRAARQSRSREDVFLDNCSRMAQSILERDNTEFNLSPELWSILAETARLQDWHDVHIRQKKKRAELEELKNVIAKIKEHGSLYEALSDGHPKVSLHIIKMILKKQVPTILYYCTPDSEHLMNSGELDLTRAREILFLHKDRACTARAINSAIDVYEKYKDDKPLFKMEQMLKTDEVPDHELKEYISPYTLNEFRETLFGALLRYLPWYSRCWMYLFGEPSSTEQIHRFKTLLPERFKEEVEEQFSEQAGPGKAPAGGISQGEVGRAPSPQVRRISQKKPAKPAGVSGKNLIRNNLKNFLNSRWTQGIMPEREDILKNEEIGNSRQLEEILGAVDGKEADFRDILAIKSVPGDNIYVTRDYLQNNRMSIQMHTRKILAEAGKGRGVDPRAQEKLRRTEARCRAVQLYLQTV